MPVLKIKDKDGNWQEVAGVSGHTHSVSQIVDFPVIEDFATEEYVDSAISSIPTPDVSGQIGIHNIAADAHNDIRVLINGLTTRLNALANSDDTTLDQMNEVVAYIKSNKSLIDSITTNKVNVSDIINNLTTNMANKPLSAAQGVALKGLIDALESEKLDTSALNDAINTSLAQAKASGEFDGADGKDGEDGNDGITPHIGNNGNWFIGNTDTGKPSRGADGKDGEDGAQGEQGIQGVQGEKGDKGDTGANGVSATHSWNGTVLTVTSASGTSSADLKGDKGDTGAQGIQGEKGATGEKGDKGDKGDTGATGASGKDGADGKDGTSVTVKSVSESSADGGNNVVTFSDGKTMTVKNGSKGSTGGKGADGKTAYAYAVDGGYAGTEAEFSAQLAVPRITPQQYGAKGDGSTDDTTAFVNALNANRVVFVPGGTYRLSGELVIRDACHLELAQDAVLNFTNTSGNCITLNRSAFLKGNHATVTVPYTFTGKVINVDTSVHTAVKDVPPFTHWCPQWKTARYLTDLNICKAYSNGLHSSHSGESNGIAVYVSADGAATSTFIWGMHFSGVRIAGAFEYGIRAVNFNNAYNHEMRIEAVMDSCKIGVSLEDCNNAYISAIVQPRRAENGTVYAKHGIQLIRCENTDLTGSRVWDWNDKNSLWTYDKSNVNQHIAMYGNCKGTILNDYNYHYMPSGFNDLRELIYCEEAYRDVNFGSLIILQEPFTRWFKPVNNEPYFNNGDGNERLVLKKEQDALFQTDYMPVFTDRLAQASDGAGGVFNEIGYKKGYYWETNGTLVSSDYHTCTGYIPCVAGDVVNVRGMSFKSGNDFCRIVLYDSNFNKIQHINRANVISNGSYYFVNNYLETEDGFSIEIVRSDTAYMTISVYTTTVSVNPVIAVGEEIAYTQVGTLAEGIKVNEQNLFGMEKYEKTGRMVTQISSASSHNQYPSAKAVYDAIQGFLGVIENGTY